MFQVPISGNVFLLGLFFAALPFLFRSTSIGSSVSIKAIRKSEAIQLAFSLPFLPAFFFSGATIFPPRNHGPTIFFLRHHPYFRVRPSYYINHHPRHHPAPRRPFAPLARRFFVCSPWARLLPGSCRAPLPRKISSCVSANPAAAPLLGSYELSLLPACRLVLSWSSNLRCEAFARFASAEVFLFFALACRHHFSRGPASRLAPPVPGACHPLRFPNFAADRAPDYLNEFRDETSPIRARGA